ncbi:MAG: dTDP-4-dehydrorhamnose 3,5-epimerase [Acidobacteria bacterium]|nr:MAG: dTDP-4-dehydrorhamnose 3,5-epimerase [Acidobacteriota bacterium]PYV73194.1 MAG: dTDP-4-dehydrorhamnose 3,5-epimerase [Acidobacteriota bacterium]
MNVLETPLSGTLILEPKVFEDERGFFLESYSERVFADLGIRERFVQDNHSYSKRGVLRGLHYQVQKPQGKLVRVVSGEVLDVFVDLRRKSPTFGSWHAVRLSGENRRLAWIPVGFAHGFEVLSEGAHVLYKSTEIYAPELERTILWNDPDLKINWELALEPVLSEKDKMGVQFRNAEVFE